MILLPQDTDRFYRIWFALLGFVNNERHIIAKFPDKPTQGAVRVEDAAKIRDVLWKHDSLLNKFIERNPINLDSSDLELVASWKNRVTGNFMILRHLKKYSIFLTESTPAHAYGVLGLVSPFEEIVGPYLPVYVQTTLLPFEDKITYDGLLSGYNITFGSGMRADMKMWLRDAEEREGIITSLSPRGEMTADEHASQIRTRNDKIIAEYRKALYKSGLSPKMVEQHTGNIKAFANQLATQSTPHTLLDLKTRDVEIYLDTLDPKATKTCVTSFKRFTRFLWDSARSDPDTLNELDSFLKSFRNGK